MNKVWIFDIDNTLANVHHRWDHLKGEMKDWKSFFDKQHLDEPYQPVFDVLHALASHRASDEIIIVTGRDERFREVSLEWLSRHIPWITNENLYMRPSNNREDDNHLKVTIIKNWLQRHPNFKVVVSSKIVTVSSMLSVKKDGIRLSAIKRDLSISNYLC